MPFLVISTLICVGATMTLGRFGLTAALVLCGLIAVWLALGAKREAEQRRLLEYRMLLASAVDETIAPRARLAWSSDATLDDDWSPSIAEGSSAESYARYFHKGK